MTRPQNPDPHGRDFREFRRALTWFVVLCLGMLVLKYAINDGAATLKWEVTRKITLGELSITLLTLGYVLVATFQWRAMNDMLAITRESNKLTLRAWVAVDEVQQFDLVPDAMIDFAVALHNTGKLPAFGHAGSSRWVHYGELPNDLPLDPLDESNTFIVGPDKQTTLHFNVGPFTKLEVEDIRLALLPLYITVTLKYSDAVKTEGLTRVTLRYMPHTETFAAYIGPHSFMR